MNQEATRYSGYKSVPVYIIAHDEEREQLGNRFSPKKTNGQPLKNSNQNPHPFSFLPLPQFLIPN